MDDLEAPIHEDADTTVNSEEESPPLEIIPLDGVIETRDDNDILVRKTTYNKGLLEGECIIFQADGKIVQKLFYKNNNLDGEALTFDDEGQVLQRLAYAQGQLDGMNRFYEKGTLAAEIPYQAGMREGKARFFAPNGQLQTEMAFSHDQQHGECIVHDPATGAVLRTETYVKGVPHGESLSYYPEGTVMIQQAFQNGLLEGHEIYYYEDGTIQQVTVYDRGIVTEPVQKFDTNGKEI